ncbi:MAG: hypothetical protein RLO50_14510 [Azospirillaceae bacterium]
MIINIEKTREQRARRSLADLGYALRRYRGRNTDDLQFGRYMVVDSATGVTVHAIGPTGPFTEDLADVEDWVRRLSA